MGLKQNGYRNQVGSFSYFGATVVNGFNLSEANRFRANKIIDLFVSQSGYSDLASFPSGASHPQALLPPLKAGGLASHNAANVIVSQAGSAVLGLPASASATITLDATATGGLIVSASGIANITLSASGSVLAVLTASGAATVELAATATISAPAYIGAQGTVTLSPIANISAIGYMSGLSTNETEFSASALADAVWTATATSYNDAGTMGEKLNDAGGAGNPWSAELSANNTAGTFGAFVQKLLTVGKFLGLK